jgi:hypothetical protein
MKRIILLIFVIIALVSCESTETNSPALQGELDNVFFSANDARASKNEDGSYNIQGITEFETLTLHIRKDQLGVYPVGGDRPNYATYEDANGNLYATNPLGSGEIVLSDRCISCGTLTGSFNFTAILPGIDTIVAQKGIFFEVKFPVPGDDDSDQGGNAGTFVAQIDGVPFNPFNVAAVNTGNNIIITGATTSTTLALRFPLDIVAGSYPLPSGGFQASYTVEGNPAETAVSGNIIIVEHDPNTNKIKGTFSFQTASTIITLGQFNVTY